MYPKTTVVLFSGVFKKKKNMPSDGEHKHNLSWLAWSGPFFRIGR